MSEVEFETTLPWRETRMGGITFHVAVCPVCQAVVEPYSKEISRGGTHGVVRYSHEHPLAFITLTQSNVSYNRYFSLQLPPEAPENLRVILEAVGKRWTSQKIHFSCDVAEVIEKMLKSEA